MKDKKQNEKFVALSTAELAREQLVKPESIRTRYCLTGSYHGIVPTRALSGRLIWKLPIQEEA